jgi:hypothetical protein
MPQIAGGGHVSGDIVELADEVSLSVSDVGTVAVQITGDWVGTLYFKATILKDPISEADWFNVAAFSPITGEVIYCTSQNGHWLIGSPGYSRVKVVATGFGHGIGVGHGLATVVLSAGQGNQLTALFAPVRLADTLLLDNKYTLPVVDIGIRKLLEQILVEIQELSARFE